MHELFKFFKYDHLPEHLQETSRQFYVLAMWMHNNLPESQESAAAMRKLLEAKDCAVRAALETI